MSITLRPYQKEPVRKAVEYFMEDNPEPSLIVLPTGAGKSIVAAEVAAACPDPILVVQPSKELLEQNLEKYRTLCGALAPAGVYSASFRKKEMDHVTFATIGSIKSLGKQFRELGFRKMLIDEAHLYPRKEQSMLGEFLRDSGIRQVLGLTATPLKLESFTQKQEKHFDKWSELIMLTNPSPSGNFFRKILHLGQIQELTTAGYWSPLRYEVLPYDRHALVMNSTGNEYTEESVVDAYVGNNIRANILAALDYHRERKHILVFVPSVEEATALASIYPCSAMVCGETPAKERQEIIRRFKSNEIRVLINVSVLSVGFDYPKIDMLIMAAPTASVARYYQIAGRAVRIDSEKKDALIVDMAGNIERFGRIEDIRFEKNGHWRMYGSGGKLLTGIPIDMIGTITRRDVTSAYSSFGLVTVMNYGKYAGKQLKDIPVSYLKWYLKNIHDSDTVMRSAIIRTIENHIRDTTAEPPVMIMPDGKHAGLHLAMVPRGYLAWYYNAQSWNTSNDSLRRGIEIQWGGVPPKLNNRKAS